MKSGFSIFDEFARRAKTAKIPGLPDIYNVICGRLRNIAIPANKGIFLYQTTH